MTLAPSPTGLPSQAAAPLDRLAVEQRGRPGAVLTMLEQLQHANPHNYLPETVVRQAAQALGVPLSQIYSVVSFYSFFNLRPQGKHSVAICRGTACHTRGSRSLLEALKASLTFASAGEPEAERLGLTTSDNLFTVRTVACFGQCALAPVAEIDRTIHGHINRQRLLASVAELSKKEGGRR